MAKLTLTDLASLTNETTAINQINANGALVEAALENTVSRDGTSPNTMSGAIDMNSNKLLNVATGTASTDGITLAQLNTATGPDTLINSNAAAVSAAAALASKNAAATSETGAAAAATTALAAKITVSTSSPSGGSNGDIWFKVST